MKPIRFSQHARPQLARRGAEEAEVIRAIRRSTWIPARSGRLECRMNFPYEREWNGAVYAVKQARPVFVEEPDEPVVVTVYTYFFNEGK